MLSHFSGAWDTPSLTQQRGEGSQEKQRLFHLFSQAIPGQGGERMLISCCYDDTDFHEGWKWLAFPVLNYAAFFAKVLVEQVPKPSSPLTPPPGIGGPRKLLYPGNQYLWQARSRPLHQGFALLGKMECIEGRWP